MRKLSRTSYLLLISIGCLSGTWAVHSSASNLLVAYNRILTFLHKDLNLEFVVGAVYLAILGFCIFSIAIAVVILPTLIFREKVSTPFVVQTLGLYVSSFIGGVIGFYGFGLLLQSLGIVAFAILEKILT